MFPFILIVTLHTCLSSTAMTFVLLVDILQSHYCFTERCLIKHTYYFTFNILLAHGRFNELSSHRVFMCAYVTETVLIRTTARVNISRVPTCTESTLCGVFCCVV